MRNSRPTPTAGMFVAVLLIAGSDPVRAAAPPDSAANAARLAPGTSRDASIAPRASRNASYRAKYDAVLSVARSQLGVPYVHFGNKDRGDRGFDCSNFTGWVYRHALGVRMSTASRTQGAVVGWPVSRSQWRPGDLLIFNNGGHVGIYIGNQQMIQCGGGLKPPRVGFLSVSPASYWGRHLTGVKRIFLGSTTDAPANPPSTTSPARANRPPVGWLDSIAGGLAVGWAVDPDASSRVIKVHFYIDGPAGRGGRLAGWRLANWLRTDVNRALGVTGYHGFHFPIPARYRDGRPHTLYVYGIDRQGGVNPRLQGSPRTFVWR